MIPTPGDDKQRVLDATDIVRLIGEHVTLRAKGREYVGLCPFHDDHKPSMCVVPAKQIYKCFSCGAGGDAITFVREYLKMGFREALEFLADRGGIKLTPWRPRTGDGGGEQFPDDAGAAGTSGGRAGLLNANLSARDFFLAILAHPEHGRAAREVIERRGISKEMVEQFELGAAPNRWDGLISTIAHKRQPAAPFVAAGLFKMRDEGQGMFDFFRNRLVFPIHDQIGRVIAFGARRLNDEDEPKYLNSAESPVFNKSATLYGLHQAAQEIRRTRLAIVTEGYMDTIACHQAGVKNAVATLGTALTRDGARVLRRLCDTVVLLFDGDEAGQKAADRALEVFFAEPIDVRIAVMSSLKERTGAKDPDELLKQEGGRALFDGMIADAVDAIDYRFARLRNRIEGMGLSARARVMEDELGRMVDLGLDNVNPIRKQMIVKQVARLLGVDEATVVGALPRRRRAFTAPGAAPGMSSAGGGAAASQPARAWGAREHLLGCILLDPSLALALEPGTEWVIAPEGFAAPAVRQIAEAVARLSGQAAAPDLRTVLASLVDVKAQAEAVALEGEVSRLTDDKAERVHAHWRDRLQEVLRERAWKQARIDAAPAALDEDGWAPDDEPEWSRLARLRELHAKVGTNRASVPKPHNG
jgi:DNA primase